jgi:hypothetical protein
VLKSEIAGSMSDADFAAVVAGVTSKGIDSKVLSQILEAYSAMAYAVMPYLPLEIAVMNLPQV